MKKRQQLNESQSVPMDEIDFSDTFLQSVFKNSETNNTENSFSRSNLVKAQTELSKIRVFAQFR